MANLTNLDGEDSKDLPRPLRDSSEQSRDQGYTKSEHPSDTNMDLKFQGTTRIDKENGNTKWQDAIDLELDQIKE